MRTMQFAVVVFAIAAFSIAASLSLAQTTLEKVIPISGKLTNSAGTSLEGKYTFEFEVFDASTEGNSLWSETKQISVAKGLWSTNLGSATALPSSIATEKQLYLEITVNSKKQAPRLALYTGLTSRDLVLPNSIGAPELKEDFGILNKITTGFLKLLNNVFIFSKPISAQDITAQKITANVTTGNAIEAYGTVVVKNNPTSTSGTINIGSGSIAYTGSAWTITPGINGNQILDGSIGRSKVSTSFIQAGSANVPSTGTFDISFSSQPTPFTSTPNIVCTAQTTNSYCVVKNPSSSGFKANVYIDSGSGASYPSGGITINWIAVGS